MFVAKLLLSNLLIVTCVLVGRRWPGLGGLLATMPLTSLIVLIWLYNEEPAAAQRLDNYIRGVVWGIGPTVAFFVAMLVCLRRGMGFPPALGIAGLAWLAGAGLHHWWVR